MNSKLFSTLVLILSINQIVGQEIAPFTINSKIATYSSQQIELDLNSISLDVNEDDLTFSLLNNSEVNGLVGVNSNTGVLTYTPDQDFSGTVNIQFVANDGVNNSEPASVFIEVISKPNQAPTAYNNHYSLKENSSINVQLNGFDSDSNDVLTYAIQTQPTNGSLEIDNNSGLIVYSPKRGFSGEDYFTFKIEDQSGSKSQESTIGLSIRKLSNNVPLGNPFIATSIQNESVLINLSGYDADNENLSYTLVEETSNGVITINEQGTGTYVPNSEFYGKDTFSFYVSDGTSNSATSQGIISIKKIDNNAPIGFNITSVVGYNSNNVIIEPTYEDADGDEVSSLIVSQAKNGEINLVDGILKYTPNVDFYGTDSFKFILNDGISDSQIITQYVNIIGPGDINADGEISATDLIYLASFIVNIEGFTMPDSFTEIFDINNDNKVSSGDLIHLASNIVGMEAFVIEF